MSGVKSEPMIRTGVDIVCLKRFEEALKENNAAYFSSVYTAHEMQCATEHPSPIAFYATRFAAKEAVFKALAIEWDDSMEWFQIEVRSHLCGSVEIHFSGRLLEIVQKNGVCHVSVSISWDADYAVAFALITTEF